MVKSKKGVFIALALVLLAWLAEILLSVKAQDYLNQGEVPFMEIFSLAIVYGGLAVILAWIILRLQGLSLKNLFRLPFKSYNSQVIIGISMGAVVAGLALFVFPILLNQFTDLDHEAGLKMNIYLQDPRLIPLWIILALFKGGFSEELWRATAIETFNRGFGRKGAGMAVLISSLVFALGHYYQGWDGVILSALSGLIYGIMFYLRRSVLEIMIAHAFRDLIAILLAYILL